MTSLVANVQLITRKGKGALCVDKPHNGPNRTARFVRSETHVPCYVKRTGRFKERRIKSAVAYAHAATKRPCFHRSINKGIGEPFKHAQVFTGKAPMGKRAYVVSTHDLKPIRRDINGSRKATIPLYHEAGRQPSQVYESKHAKGKSSLLCAETCRTRKFFRDCMHA